MNPRHRDVRVFVSSTFHDLEREREHLVRKVFPEIRHYCRERAITFTEIDLRWGITSEDAARGKVITTCLDEIDRCRPFFIAILGERYGWVPPFHEIQKDASYSRSIRGSRNRRSMGRAYSISKSRMRC